MTYTPVPLHPPVRRDLSLIVPEGATHEDVVTAMGTVGAPFSSAFLFDVYELPEGRALGYHLTFRAPGRTLTADEVNAAEARILAVLEALGVTRRA